MYAIKFSVNGKEKYLDIDRASGGYPYWSNSLNGALWLNTEKEAMDIIIEEELLDLSIYNKKGNGLVSIVEIRPIEIKSYSTYGIYQE